MNTLPVIDLQQWHAPGAERTEFLRQLHDACSSTGFFYLKNHGIPPALINAVLRQANRFFDLPDAVKENMHIRHSAHFRGYSQMKNERDWREQAHFSLELPEPAGNLPDCYRLTGPNLWPENADPAFQRTIPEYLDAVQKLGETLLQAMAASLTLPETAFAHSGSDLPYTLLKLICYYAQPNAIYDRPGVAAHCDWSWLTILLQDEVGGLEILRPEGTWQAAPPQPETLSVNLGELMEIATKGLYHATAHRVINPSEQNRRVSIPVFINPPLSHNIRRIVQQNSRTPVPTEHVHRVVAEGQFPDDFNFGESEWNRKGRGLWCHRAQCR